MQNGCPIFRTPVAIFPRRFQPPNPRQRPFNSRSQPPRVCAPSLSLLILCWPVGNHLDRAGGRFVRLAREFLFSSFACYVLLRWIDPSPVRTTIGDPPPFIFPLILDELNVPSTVTGNPRLMCPSCVLTSRFAWISPGKSRSTLPSPVVASTRPSRSRPVIEPSPVRSRISPLAPCTAMLPSPVWTSRLPLID